MRNLLPLILILALFMFCSSENQNPVSSNNPNNSTAEKKLQKTSEESMPLDMPEMWAILRFDYEPTPMKAAEKPKDKLFSYKLFPNVTYGAGFYWNSPSPGEVLYQSTSTLSKIVRGTPIEISIYATPANPWLLLSANTYYEFTETLPINLVETKTYRCWAHMMWKAVGTVTPHVKDETITKTYQPPM